MKKLSPSDVTLLRALQADAEVSNEKLGELANLSGSAVSRRVAELKKAKVITGIHARVDPDQLGLKTTIFTLVSLKIQGDGMTKAFEREIETMPNIIEWSRISGSWDYLLKFVVRDTRHHDRLHHQLLTLSMVSRLRGMHVIDSPRVQPIPLDLNSPD